MNKNLENAISNAAKIDAIMYAMNHTFSDLIVKPEYSILICACGNSVEIPHTILRKLRGNVCGNSTENPHLNITVT